MITIAGKKYEKYKDKNFNNKHESMSKNAHGMYFESYSNRVLWLDDH